MKLEQRWKNQGLRRQLFVWFVLLVASILALLWLLQTVFFHSFYEQMKRDEIERLARSLKQTYAQAENVFAERAAAAAFDNGIRIDLLDEHGESLKSWDVFDRKGHRGDSPLSPPVLALLRERQQIGATHLTRTLSDGPGGRMSLFHLLLLDDDAVLCLSVPLSPMEATVQVLARQLALVTVIALLVSILVAFYLSRRITKPVTALAKQAERFARDEEEFGLEGGSFRELDELAAALNSAREERKILDRMRSEMVANVSHDLRTPLTIIKSYAEMIRDISGENPERRREHLRVIIDESDKLAQFVTEILELSRIREGKLPMKPVDFDLSVLLTELITALRPVCEQEMLLECEHPCFVKADPDRIRQVLYNLISNAVEHGDKSPIRIRLLERSDTVRCEIVSGGSPLAEEECRTIWERYYRENEDEHGRGIGLSIVSAILTAHGAAFGVEAVEYGNCFWFEL